MVVIHFLHNLIALELSAPVERARLSCLSFLLLSNVVLHMPGLQIRTLGMLRSRFQSLPGAFNGCLIPEEKGEAAKKKGLKATLSRKFDAVRFSFYYLFSFVICILFIDLISLFPFLFIPVFFTHVILSC